MPHQLQKSYNNWLTALQLDVFFTAAGARAVKSQ